MTLHVAIIGGGASGTLLAAQLLRQRVSLQQLRITIIESRNNIGCGIAYSTDQSCNILNTRVHNMSAFPDDPDHFTRWLENEGLGAGEGMSFVSRKIYGRYLSQLITADAGEPAVPRLTILKQHCTGLNAHAHGVEVVLGDGSVVPCHYAVLATGYCRDGSAVPALDDPWCPTTPHDPDRPVVLVGTGLTMVDMVLSLQEKGQRAPIYALSRRGLLPQPHMATKPLKLSAADVPFGTNLGYFLHWLRTTIRDHEAGGGNWRDVLDGLRPHIQSVWRHLPMDSRLRFLRHVSSLWDTHRHRMPPQSAEGIDTARASGLLRIVRGGFQAATRTADGTRVSYRASGSHEKREIEAGLAIDCRGFGRLSQPIETPLIRSLIESGTARIDDLGLGLVFDQDDCLVDARGVSNPRLLGIGPVTRATHWEITAVPDIREQVTRTARRLLDHGQQQSTQARHTRSL